MHEKSGISLYNVPPLPNETATDFAIILILVVVAVTFAGCQPRPASAIVAIDASATPPGGEFGTEVAVAWREADRSAPGFSDTILRGWGIYYTKPDTATVNYNNTTTQTQDPSPITFRADAFALNHLYKAQIKIIKSWVHYLCCPILIHLVNFHELQSALPRGRFHFRWCSR